MTFASGGAMEVVRWYPVTVDSVAHPHDAGGVDPGQSLTSLTRQVSRLITRNEQ